jgi:hypothetical protein
MVYISPLITYRIPAKVIILIMNIVMHNPIITVSDIFRKAMKQVVQISV